jgi:hypothetical protein
MGVLPFLKRGDIAGAKANLEQRGNDILSRNGVPTQTMKARAILDQPGGVEQLIQGSEQLISQATRLGIIEPVADTRTSLGKNLEAAGLVPGSPEYQAAILTSINKPATSINIGDKGRSKEMEALATGRASQLTKFRDERETSIDTNQSLDVLENIDVNTGALEPSKLALAKFGRAFGVDTSGIANVSAGEGFNAEAKRIVLAVKASQKGPQTDKDEDTIRATVANLGNSKAGNQFIMDSARALNNRRIGRADFFDDFLESNETLKGANQAWSKFKRDTPMVSAVMRTPQGLPVFFYQFDQAVRSANPDATRPEILEAWRGANKKGKK